MVKRQVLTIEQIAKNIGNFARENDLKIHPGQEALKWADLVVNKGGCPCVPGKYLSRGGDGEF